MSAATGAAAVRTTPLYALLAKLVGRKRPSAAGVTGSAGDPQAKPLLRRQSVTRPEPNALTMRFGRFGSTGAWDEVMRFRMLGPLLVDDGAS
jgi:hypothetical protein